MHQTETISVSAVQTRSDYQDFVDLPWRVPMDRPMVRPMRELQRHLFDRGKRFRGSLSLSALVDGMLFGKENPFYEHGDLEMFLARAEGRPIARMAAIQNRLHNEYHHDRLGFFGFYECVDSGVTGREATGALVEAAGAWLTSRGLTGMRGPFSPTINDEVGIWTEGDTYPTFLIPSNPRHYAGLLEAAGLTAVKSLFIYREPVAGIPDDRLDRWFRRVERIRQASNFHLRAANFKNLDSEVANMVTIYNATECDNWGFQPMSFGELRSMAELFQYMLDPNLIRVLEVEENGARKVIGGTITLPDLNEILRHTGGRLVHPYAIWKLLRMKMGQPTHRIRAAFLGVLPEYRNTMASTILLVDSFKVAKTFGFKDFEGSWILEDNLPMIKPMEDWGMVETDRYLIFERALG